MELQTTRGIGEIPRTWYQCGGHDPRNAYQGNIRHEQRRRSHIYSLPGGGAYYTPASVLCFDRAELKVDVLREISYEREDFAHALVHHAQGRKNIQDCARDGLDTLFRSFRVFDELRLGRNQSIYELTLRYAKVGGGRRISTPHQSTQQTLVISPLHDNEPGTYMLIWTICP